MQPPTHFGPYRVESDSIRDGIATRYDARHNTSGDEVTLKLFPRQLVQSAAYQARLAHESALLLKTTHPALVLLIDITQDGEHLYFAAQPMPGGTLSERIAGSPLPHAEIVRIISRVASALNTLHGLGIVHRNLRPNSILFDAAGAAYLANVGEITLPEIEATLPDDTILHAMAYMSPEQIDGAPELKPQSDIYALGVVLFEMLTGQWPFTSSNPSALATQHAAKPVPTIRETLHGVRPASPNTLPEPSMAAPGVELVVTQALAKLPEERFASAGELATELARHLRGSETMNVPRAAPQSPAPEQTDEPYEAWDWDAADDD